MFYGVLVFYFLLGPKEGDFCVLCVFLVVVNCVRVDDIYLINKMPKKPVINAYALFVDDKKKSGTPFQGNPYEYFGPAWNALSEHDKQKYSDLAKQLKFQQKSNLECKFTTSGQSYAEVERIRKEKRDKLLEMNKTIEDTVASLEMEGKLVHHPFFLMHVNYFCVSDQGVYYPAEVGLVRFSLANGIEDFYHKILHPGPFPTGSFRNAMEYSKETHNLPCPPDATIAERDFNKIDREIKEFLLGKEGFAQAVGAYRQMRKPIDLPPIYTYYNKEMLHFNKDNDVVIKSFMENLPEDTRVRYTVRVYELTKLLYEVCNACARQAGKEHAFPSIISAQAELERDIFSHSLGIGCHFHEEGDYVHQCSLSWAKRWGFIIAEFSCKHLGIGLILGAHCPVKAAPFQRIDAPVHLQEAAVKRNVQPSPAPVPYVSTAEVLKKRVPIKEPLKELRQPQASCIDTLASQLSEKLKTCNDEPAGPVMGAGRGVAGAGRGMTVAGRLGASVVNAEAVAVAGRGRRLPESSDN